MMNVGARASNEVLESGPAVTSHGNRRLFYRTVGQTVITTTEDKVRLCMHEHLKIMGARQSWISPMGICLAILLTLITADFHDRWGIPKSTWQAFFLICFVLSVIWLVASIAQIGRRHTIDDVVEELKSTDLKFH